MNQYRYETHLHTTQASACARVSAAEHVNFYKNTGYSGIVVTDHFFNGNSCIPKELPWEQRIDLFCKGYEDAKKEGDRIGLSVFFGLEVNFRGTEFLIYGVDKTWLKNHPDMLSWTVDEQYRHVHAAGGFIIHAHPFRVRPYIKEVRLFPEAVDAVEAINVGNGSDEFDRQAMDYAKQHHFPVTAGTDAHGKESLHSGIAFQHKIKDMQDLIDSIRSGEGELILPQ